MVDLTQHPLLAVRQQVDHIEIFTGLEAANRYVVETPEGESILYAYEESNTLARQFLGGHHPLTLTVIDAQGQLVMTATRKFFWFLSHLNIFDGTGNQIGYLKRRLSFVGRRFDLGSQDELALTEVRGPMLRPHTFMINQQGSEVGRITKLWSGLAKEALTKADNFQVEFNDPGSDQSFRLLVLATAFAIDLAFFEKRTTRRTGMMGRM